MAHAWDIIEHLWHLLPLPVPLPDPEEEKVDQVDIEVEEEIKEEEKDELMEIDEPLEDGDRRDDLD